MEILLSSSILCSVLPPPVFEFGVYPGKMFLSTYFSELKILVKKILWGDNLHFQTVSFHKQVVGSSQDSDHVNSLGKDDLIAWMLLADPQAFCGSSVGENPSLLNISFLVLAVIYSRH